MLVLCSPSSATLISAKYRRHSQLRGCSPDAISCLLLLLLRSLIDGLTLLLLRNFLLEAFCYIVHGPIGAADRLTLSSHFPLHQQPLLEIVAFLSTAFSQEVPSIFFAHGAK